MTSAATPPARNNKSLKPNTDRAQPDCRRRLKWQRHPRRSAVIAFRYQHAATFRYTSAPTGGAGDNHRRLVDAANAAHQVKELRPLCLQLTQSGPSRGHDQVANLFHFARNRFSTNHNRAARVSSI
jgi:hypothetical protein